MLSRFSKFAPAGHLDLVRAGLAAAAGLVLVLLVCRLWLGSATGLPLLIAPMGASAVLIFAIPASPLARPWAVFGGNVISALVGVACAKALPGSLYMAPVAGGLATIAMRACRCLHPPGGAVALTAVAGGAPIIAAGWSFAVVPVALNCVILIAAALALNNVAGHSYPHRAAPKTPPPSHGTRDAAPVDRAGYTLADIDAVLATYDELLDVSRQDLDVLFRKVEAQAHRRLHRTLRCADIMSRDVIFAGPDDGVGQTRDRLLAHGLGTMPVLDSDRTVLGCVGHAQLLAGAGRIVRDVMQPAGLAKPDLAIDALLPLLSGGQQHEVLVVDDGNRLLGMITQTDLLATLWRSHVAEQVAGLTPA